MNTKEHTVTIPASDYLEPTTNQNGINETIPKSYISKYNQQAELIFQLFKHIFSAMENENQYQEFITKLRHDINPTANKLIAINSTLDQAKRFYNQ